MGEIDGFVKGSCVRCFETKGRIVQVSPDGVFIAWDFHDPADARPSVQDWIVQECDAIKALLLEKNRKYGNSALEPIGIFCKEPATTQIKARIDDKLKRIQQIGSGDNEDTIADLIGYLILLRIAKREGK